MGFFKDNTVEVKFNGKSYRVSQGVADSLSKNKKLDKTLSKKDKK